MKAKIKSCLLSFFKSKKFFYVALGLAFASLLCFFLDAVSVRFVSSDPEMAIAMKEMEKEFLPIKIIPSIFLLSFGGLSNKGEFVAEFSSNVFGIIALVLIVLTMTCVILDLFLDSKVESRKNRFYFNCTFRILTILFIILTLVFVIVTATSKSVTQLYFETYALPEEYTKIGLGVGSVLLIILSVLLVIIESISLCLTIKNESYVVYFTNTAELEKLASFKEKTTTNSKKSFIPNLFDKATELNKKNHIFIFVAVLLALIVLFVPFTQIVFTGYDESLASAMQVVQTEFNKVNVTPSFVQLLFRNTVSIPFETPVESTYPSIVATRIIFVLFAVLIVCSISKLIMNKVQMAEKTRFYSETFLSGLITLIAVVVMFLTLSLRNNAELASWYVSKYGLPGQYVASRLGIGGIIFLVLIVAVVIFAVSNIVINIINRPNNQKDDYVENPTSFPTLVKRSMIVAAFVTLASFFAFFGNVFSGITGPTFYHLMFGTNAVASKIVVDGQSTAFILNVSKVSFVQATFWIQLVLMLLTILGFVGCFKERNKQSWVLPVVYALATIILSFSAITFALGTEAVLPFVPYGISEISLGLGPLFYITLTAVSVTLLTISLLALGAEYLKNHSKKAQ